MKRSRKEEIWEEEKGRINKDHFSEIEMGLD